MKSIKSKVIATLFALCFALLGYSCQCEAQAQPVEPKEPVIKNAIALYSDSPFTLKTNTNSKNWKKADDSDGYIGYCSTNSDNENDWQVWNGTAISAAKNENNPDPDKYYIYLRGIGNITISGGAGCGFAIASTDENAKVTLDGNMMNLLDYTKDYSNPANLTIPGNYCFAHLFGDCDALETLGSDFSLPATTLANNCYENMFMGCSSLTSAPALPATTLKDNCYENMFMGCSSLTSAPALPATTLADSCYKNMFTSCSSLTSAPALPAETLADSCYYCMFTSCSSLTSAPALPATTLASNCYYGMFYNCTFLTSAPALPATTLKDYCYESMFQGCSSLISVPALPAPTLAEYCYRHMFDGCSSLKFSSAETNEYKNKFKIGSSPSGVYNALKYMFTGTGGTYTSNPTGGATYYTSNTVIPAN